MSEDFLLAASRKRTTMCAFGALELFLSGRRKPCFQPVKVLKIIGCPLVPVLPVRVRPGDIKTCSKRARDGLGKYTAQTFLLAQAASNSIFPPLCGIAIAKFLAGWLPSGVRRIPRLSSSTRPLWGSTSRHTYWLPTGTCTTCTCASRRYKNL